MEIPFMNYTRKQPARRSPRPAWLSIYITPDLSGSSLQGSRACGVCIDPSCSVVYLQATASVRV